MYVDPFWGGFLAGAFCMLCVLIALGLGNRKNSSENEDK